MNLIHFFERNAREFPNRKAIVFNNEVWSYAQADNLARRIASGLIDSGVQRETKCAVLSRNDAMSFIILLGILKTRGTWVPLHAGNPDDVLRYMIEFFDVEVLFYQKEFETLAQWVKLNLPSVRNFYCIDDDGNCGPRVALWAENQSGDVPDTPWDPEATIMLRGTGGTTGLPKAVMNTNRNLVATLANYQARMSMDGVPVNLAVAPLTHAASIFAFINMSFGGTLIIHPKFDPLAVMQAIQSHQVSFLYLPPTAIYKLLAHAEVNDFDYSSLRYFLYGAAPMSAAKLAEAIATFGPVMTQSFGQHEAPAGATFLSPADHLDADGNIDRKRLLSCGRPFPFTRVALMDDDGNFVVEPDVPGEIVLQGEVVFKGYYKNQEATDEVSRFGWHHTGDVAYWDDAGFLYICDRKKEMIISGGFNIYPLEVEQVLLEHTAVQDCAVVGVPDQKWGEAVRAVVELKREASVSDEELISYCRERLGPIKTPKSVEFVTDLPRSPVGKVLRRAVRDKYWTEQPRRV